MSEKSREALQQFLDYLGEKGMVAKATAQARKAAVGKILGILSEAEATDITDINLDDLVERFGRLHGRDYTPQSLVTYKSRVRSSLDDFINYQANPLAFRAGASSKSARSGKPQQSSSATDKKHQKTVRSDGPLAIPSANILPIQIRADLTIHVQGLPFDLSEAEAKRIANVILALAT